MLRYMNSFPDCFSGLGTTLQLMDWGLGMRLASHTIPHQHCGQTLKSQVPDPNWSRKSHLVSCPAVHTLGWLGTRLNQTFSRGIATCIIRVEAFATGNQSKPFLRADQGIKVTSKLQQLMVMRWSERVLPWRPGIFWAYFQTKQQLTLS